MARSDGLSDVDRGILRSILAKYADRITRVDIFGSRATDRWRANSDVDLAIHGDIAGSEIDRLWTLFDDSNLSISVDIIAYNEEVYPPLRHHIDSCARLLFASADLHATQA